MCYQDTLFFIEKIGELFYMSTALHLLSDLIFHILNNIKHIIISVIFYF